MKALFTVLLFGFIFNISSSAFAVTVKGSVVDVDKEEGLVTLFAVEPPVNFESALALEIGEETIFDNAQSLADIEAGDDISARAALTGNGRWRAETLMVTKRNRTGVIPVTG